MAERSSRRSSSKTGIKTKSAKTGVKAKSGIFSEMQVAKGYAKAVGPSVVKPVEEKGFSKARAEKIVRTTAASKLAGFGLSDFFTDRGNLAVERVASSFGMTKTQLAETVGISREVFYKPNRTKAVKVQNRVQEMVEIVERVKDWSGGPNQAIAWYRSQPIPAFGGRTAESLVKDGKAAELRDYLDAIAVGGFA